MSNSTKMWYALYTRQGQEKKVASLLSRKNIEHYCPMKRSWNGRRKVVLEPLLTSFVFVKSAAADLVQVRSIDSVLNFVYWLGKPAVIQEEEVEIMKRFMNEYSNIEVEKIPFNVNGMARVVNGAAEDVKMHRVSVTNNSVRIVLPSLGYVMVAEIDSQNLQPAKQSTPSFPAFLDNYRFAF